MLQQLIDAIARFFNGLKPWVIIAPWEQGLRIRLGKYIKRLDAGFHLRLPFIDIIIQKSVRTRLSQMGQQTMMLRDGSVITIGASLGFKISDIQKLYETLHDAEMTIVSLAKDCIVKSVAECDSCDTDNIQKLTMQKIKLLDLEQSGIVITHIAITGMSKAKTYRIIGDMEQNPYTYNTFRTGPVDN